MEANKVSYTSQLSSNSILTLKGDSHSLSSSTSGVVVGTNKTGGKHIGGSKTKSLTNERSYAFIHITSVFANMYTHESSIQPVELTFAKLIPIAKDTTETISSSTSQSSNSDISNSDTTKSGNSVVLPNTNNSSSPVTSGSSTNTNTPPASVTSASTTPSFRAIGKSTIPLLLIQYTTNTNLATINNTPLLGLPLMIVKPDNIESIYFENGIMRIVRVKDTGNGSYGTETSTFIDSVREEIFFSTTEANSIEIENWNKQVQTHVLAFQSFWASIKAKIERKQAKASKLEKKGNKGIVFKEIIVPDSPNTGMITPSKESNQEVGSKDKITLSDNDDNDDDDEKNMDNESIFAPSTTTAGTRHGVLRSSSKIDRAGLSRREFRRLLIEGRLSEFQEAENDPDKRKQIVSEVQALAADPATEPVKKKESSKTTEDTVPTLSVKENDLSNSENDTIPNKVEKKVDITEKSTEKSKGKISTEETSSSSASTVISTPKFPVAIPDTKEWSSMIADEKDDIATENEKPSLSSTEYNQPYHPSGANDNHSSSPSWSSSYRNIGNDYNNSNRGRPRYRGSMHHYSNSMNSSFSSQPYYTNNSSPNNRHWNNYNNEYRNNSNNGGYNNQYYNSPWNNNNGNGNDKTNRDRTNSVSSMQHQNKSLNSSLLNPEDSTLNTSMTTAASTIDGKDVSSANIVRHNPVPVASQQTYYPSQPSPSTVPSPVINPSPTSPAGYQMYTVTIPVPINPSTTTTATTNINNPSSIPHSYPSYASSPLNTSMNTGASSTNPSGMSTLVPVNVPMNVPMLIPSNPSYAPYVQGQTYVDSHTGLPFNNSSQMLSMQLLAMAQQQYQLMVQQQNQYTQPPSQYQYLVASPPIQDNGSSTASSNNNNNTVYGTNTDHSNHGHV